MAVENEQQPCRASTVGHNYRALECRNFWRAGGYEPPSSSKSPRESLELSNFDVARVHPKFLHSNATSHKWAFGAIAELLDNAVDEICNGATYVIADKIDNPKDKSAMLLFQDDGGGMSPEGIRKCMSLGFSSKTSKKTIGQYGNGFKTSTMRLGADAILFTCATAEGRTTQSIGMLSYTFLRRTLKDDIIVPMLDFGLAKDQVTPIIYTSQNDWNDNLKTIIDWSPFSSKEELLGQFEDIGFHGTKVLIYNLWMNDDGLLELDFDDDDEDIVLRDQANAGGFTKYDKEIVRTHISYTLRYSLRAYISVLYLRKFTKFQIVLRGKPVEQVSIIDMMKSTQVKTYRPNPGTSSESVTVKVTIGFAKEAPVLGIFGFNVYHKNRLIMPFWKVLQGNSSVGRCVLGFLEANFMEPAHDKQDFERTSLFIRLEARLKQMVVEYWKDKCESIGYQGPEMLKMRRTEKSQAENSKKMPHAFNRIEHHQLQISPHVVELAADENLDSSSAPLTQVCPQRSTLDLCAPQEDFGQRESMDFRDPTLIDKLSEENIQLFIRREELQSKQEELKHRVEKLEQELEERKRKCSELASQLEDRKRQFCR